MGSKQRTRNKVKYKPKPNSLATGFMDDVDHYSAMKGIQLGSISKFIRNKHWDLYGNRAPGVHLDVVKARIIYELQLEGHKAMKKEDRLPPHFHQNRKAALANKPEEFDPKTRCLFREAIMFNREKTKGEPMKAKKKKKTAKKEKATKKQKVMKIVGKKKGLGIAETWVKIFEENERVKKSLRLTDEQISNAIKAEFPERKSDIFNYPNVVRARYNKGGQTRGVVPKIVSYQYDKDGDKVVRSDALNRKATKRKAK